MSDSVFVDCNLHDPADEYFSGSAQYECEQASSSVNGEFILISDEDCYLLMTPFIIVYTLVIDDVNLSILTNWKLHKFLHYISGSHVVFVKE